jgi:hypothetical protein
MGDTRPPEITPFGVPPAVMREMRGFFIRMFALGCAIAAAGVYWYWRHSPSQDKIFHCFLIMAACGFTFPMFTASVRLMVRMYYMNHAGMQKQEEMVDGFREVKNDAKPIVADVRTIVHKITVALEKYSNDDLVKSFIAEFKKELDSEDGAVKRFMRKMDEAVEGLKALTAPVGQPRKPGLLERGINGGQAPPLAEARPAAPGGAPDPKAETKVLEPVKAGVRGGAGR